MKVTIGPYKSWIGPYQLADLLQHVGVSEDRCDKIGEWLADTWVSDVCQWIDSKRERKVKIKLQPYDTWSMDHTLALIVLPMLKQLQDTKHGSPFVDDKDVPVELRSTSAPATKHEWDTDGNFHKRWEWIMDELIWTFEQLVDDDWESQYHSGHIEHIHVPCNAAGEECAVEDAEYFRLEKGPNDTSTFDKSGYQKHAARIANGLKLFGKYYQGLWD